MQTETPSNLVQNRLSPDGNLLGQSTSDLIGFYGLSTRIAQPSSASQATVSATAVTAIGTTTLSAANTSGVFGFASSTAGQALVTRVDQLQVDVAAAIVLVNQLRDDLVSLNLIAGS